MLRRRLDTLLYVKNRVGALRVDIDIPVTLYTLYIFWVLLCLILLLLPTHNTQTLK